MTSSFTARYAPLAVLAPEWGQVATLPWDAACFGFEVGDYRLGDQTAVATATSAVRQALDTWADAGQVELIGCTVAAEHRDRVLLVQRLGFVLVDTGLGVSLPRLHKADLPPGRIPVRQAQGEDWPGILSIAESAFQFGRYHADPRFPIHLANRRYRLWAENALLADDSETRVYAIGEPGAPRGFFHVVIRQGCADLRLGAVDRASASGIAGYYLYAGVLHALKAEGARSAVARIQPGNTAVMNIYAGLGFQFSRLDLWFHWHAPGAPHMIAGDNVDPSGDRKESPGE